MLHSPSSWPRPLVLSLVLALASTTPLATQTLPPVPTHTSVAAPALVPGGGFENASVITFAYAPTWPNWVFTAQGPGGGSGIARNGATILGRTPPAPGGQCVAFVEGSTSLGTTLSGIAPGKYRLRFRAARRTVGGVVDNQGLVASINGRTVFEGDIQSTYAIHRSAIVTLTATGALAIEFRGTATTGAAAMALIDRVELDPVLPWNSGASWVGGVPPQSGDEVLIAPDTAIAMDGPCVARSVQVQGQLVAAEQDGSLATDWVLVSGGGSSFTVGTEGAPFSFDFQLTLQASNPNETILQGSTKFLMAMDGGIVSMHGAPKRSWSHLEEIRGSGPTSKQIVVDDLKGWQVGDRIVIAFTGLVSHNAPGPTGPNPNPYQGPRSQVRTITELDVGAREVTLDAEIDHEDHCDAPHNTMDNGKLPSDPAYQTWDVRQRAEVGNLSRNVRIVGTNTGAGDQGGFGGHVMIMACCNAMQPGFGQFSNIEMRDMGRRNKLGRYPMHWHMQRDNGYGQYIRNCAISHTFNRAITIHGSHGVEVRDNVCHDAEGHAVFLEDGVERYNQIIGNLVLATRKPVAGEEMLPHDRSLDQPQNRSPAAFWISHPTNYFEGNVAADSFGTGYWFALHRKPTGLSSTTDWVGSFSDPDPMTGTPVPWNATRATLGSFVGNLSHSVKMGFDLHDSVDDMGTVDLSEDDDILTNVGWKPPTVTDLVDYRAYGCTVGIYTGAMNDYPSDIRFVDAVLTDNGLHTQFASADTLTQSLMVYDNGNEIFPTPYNGMYTGHIAGYDAGHAHVLYDGPARIEDSHLVGYDGAMAGNMFYSQFGAARRHTNHEVRGLTYAGGPSAIPNISFLDFNDPSIQNSMKSPQVWGIVVHDIDGSLTRGLFPGRSLISNHYFMHLVDAAGQSDDLPHGNGNGRISPRTWGHLQVRYYAGVNTNLLLATDFLPSTTFRRHPYLTYPESIVSTTQGGSQMRQIPIIVQTSAGPAECVYEFEIREPDRVLLRDGTYAYPPTPLRRVDVSLDDAATGHRARLLIRHALLSSQPSWTPSLYINDDQDKIHVNGDNPSTTTLQPVGPLGGIRTGYAIVNLGTAQSPNWAIDLQMINPSRTFRVSIVW